MKVGDRIFMLDMYNGIIEGTIISQEEYQSISKRRGTGGATLAAKNSLPIRYGVTDRVCVCPKDEIFQSYNEAVVYKVMAK